METPTVGVTATPMPSLDCLNFGVGICGRGVEAFAWVVWGARGFPFKN